MMRRPALPYARTTALPGEPTVVRVRRPRPRLTPRGKLVVGVLTFIGECALVLGGAYALILAVVILGS